MRQLATISAGVVVAACIACGSTGAEATQVVCTLSGPTVTPAQVQMAPGDTLRARAAGSSCYGAILPARWASLNTLIVTVDSLSGLVTAKQTGAAVVTATNIGDPRIGAAMFVIVAAK